MLLWSLTSHSRRTVFKVNAKFTSSNSGVFRVFRCLLSVFNIRCVANIPNKLTVIDSRTAKKSRKISCQRWKREWGIMKTLEQLSSNFILFSYDSFIFGIFKLLGQRTTRSLIRTIYQYSIQMSILPTKSMTLYIHSLYFCRKAVLLVGWNRSFCFDNCVSIHNGGQATVNYLWR